MPAFPIHLRVEQEPVAIRQKVRKPVARLPVQLRHGHRRAPEAETRNSGPAVLGGNRMTPSAFQVPPRPARPLLMFVDTAADIEPLQLARCEEADRLAIGRPEGIACPLGSGQRLRGGGGQ